MINCNYRGTKFELVGMATMATMALAVFCLHWSGITTTQHEANHLSDNTCIGYRDRIKYILGKQH